MLCEFAHSSSTRNIHWQDFETLCLHMDAVREMMTCRSRLPEGVDEGGGEGENIMSVNHYYCVDRRSSTIGDEFEMILRTHCFQTTSYHRFPPAQWTGWNDPLGITTAGVALQPENGWIKNAEGAICDGLTKRATPDGGHILFCGQQKYYNHIEMVTSAMIREEAAKVAQLPVPYILVMMVTKLHPDALQQLPDRCIVMNHEALRAFFGPIMYGRLFLQLTSSSWNVNTAEYSDLNLVPGIGDALAKLIIVKRAQEAFRDWDDLRARIPRIQRKARNYLSY